MRILVAIVFAAACGGPQHKKEGAVVNEGSDTPTTCCCKTIPLTAEKEITPEYAMAGRMECSSKNGECVDDVQCNASQQPKTSEGHDTGVPPPPVLPPSTSSSGIP